MSPASTQAESKVPFAPILVADIGGTNARFALITDYLPNDNEFVISHRHTFPSSDFSTFEDAISEYLAQLSEITISRACLAVAGPVKGEEVMLTNLGWHFNVTQLKARFDFSNLQVINDFAAFAYAAPYLNTSDNIVVKQGQAQAQANIAVFGPGTGFGAACLVRSQGNQAVMSCEAGHISLAPVTELDRQLHNVLRDELQHVSVENVFAGPGIARLYQAMAKVEGAQVNELDAAQIAALAQSGECHIATKTLNHFCDWIGSVAGDIALSFGALGGVYIGGGILPRMHERLLNSRFNERFIAKGMMSQYNSQIPVTLVCQENIPFIGAAACIHQGQSKD
ncbi:Glucokinase [Pseudoalteromonas sp. THAF3]|uniref:glucokinase n=1 Tax=Pseudoalteromonas sp. THAF3 TaxID=2587843 RepID=UPI0012687202|nr:glucokinase [Pseudoalteromonas sp. THAF3]QFU05076.1 Glucokinase [Pseudoalteromonas sp. THAF3]